MRHARIGIGLSLALRSLVAIAGPPTPPDLQGDWVPASSSCASPLRFQAGASEFTLRNGADKATYGDVAWPSEYFGPDYQGISVVAIPDFEGSQPFTVFFHADEKKGVTKLSIVPGQDSGGKNPAYDAIIRTARKFNDRFPVDGIPLKKCPGTASASIRDVSGDYTYQGRGTAKVAQQGPDVRILCTWTPLGPGPHYEAKGRLAGDTITGTWYSLYAKKGPFRFVGVVGADGSIDLSGSDDPINANIRKTVLWKATR